MDPPFCSLSLWGRQKEGGVGPRSLSHSSSQLLLPHHTTLLLLGSLYFARSSTNLLIPPCITYLRGKKNVLVPLAKEARKLG